MRLFRCGSVASSGPLLLLPLAIGLGASAQAWAGAALMRRFVEQPVVLNAPRDILLAAALGALLACTVSASVATAALWFTGVVPAMGVPGFLADLVAG
jgi:integral membrane sensor domain MASE1